MQLLKLRTPEEQNQIGIYDGRLFVYYAGRSNNTGQALLFVSGNYQGTVETPEGRAAIKWGLLSGESPGDSPVLTLANGESVVARVGAEVLRFTVQQMQHSPQWSEIELFIEPAEGEAPINPAE